MIAAALRNRGFGFASRRSRVRSSHAPWLHKRDRGADGSPSPAADPAHIPRKLDFADGFVERWPWRLRRKSLLTPEDHAEMLEGLVAVVEAFDLLGSVA